MFSKAQTETFLTTIGNTGTYAVYTVPGAQTGELVFMLLKSAPIFQTIQLGFSRIYSTQGLIFSSGKRPYVQLGRGRGGLKEWPLAVSYVPNPTYHGVI
jgi:hypothetical protein